MAGLTNKIRSWIKKPQNRLEIAVDVICLVASYGLLFLIPHNINIFFWILFALSAFLFCIGFFRLWGIIDIPKTKNGTLISGVLLVLIGLILNSTGAFVIYAANGSEWSIAIAVLLLIEAIVMYSMTACYAVSPRAQWIMSLIFRIAAVPMAAGAIAYIIVDRFSARAIALGVLLLIEGIVFWAFGRGNDPYNPSESPVRVVPGMHKTVAELCSALADTETQLGYPWVGKIRSLKEDTIIYGPSDNGAFVYGHYHFGRFYVTYSDDKSFLDPEEAKKHRMTEIPDRKGVFLCADMLPEAYANMITLYLEKGNIVWSTNQKKSKKKR